MLNACTQFTDRECRKEDCCLLNNHKEFKMQSVTSLLMENCENDIKFQKKMIIGQFIWVIFNLSITYFDWVALDYSHPKSIGIAFGSIAVTTLFSILFLIDSLIDLRKYKLRYKFLTEIHAQQLASGEIAQYINAQNTYEQLIKNLSEKYPEFKRQ